MKYVLINDPNNKRIIFNDLVNLDNVEPIEIKFINRDKLRMCKILEIRANLFKLMQYDVIDNDNNKVKIKIRKEGY